MPGREVAPRDTEAVVQLLNPAGNTVPSGEAGRGRGRETARRRPQPSPRWVTGAHLEDGVTVGGREVGRWP